MMLQPRPVKTVITITAEAATTLAAATILAVAEAIAVVVVVREDTMVVVEGVLNTGFHLPISSSHGHIHGNHGQLHHVLIPQQVHRNNSLEYLALGLSKPT
jgi:hypothetical protein